MLKFLLKFRIESSNDVFSPSHLAIDYKNPDICSICLRCILASYSNPPVQNGSSQDSALQWEHLVYPIDSSQFVAFRSKQSLNQPSLSLFPDVINKSSPSNSTPSFSLAIRINTCFETSFPIFLPRKPPKPQYLMTPKSSVYSSQSKHRENHIPQSSHLFSVCLS